MQQPNNSLLKSIVQWIVLLLLIASVIVLITTVIANIWEFIHDRLAFKIIATSIISIGINLTVVKIWGDIDKKAEKKED